MGRSEGVIDVDVGQRRELGGKRRVVLFFGGVEPQVLEQDDAAGMGGNHLGSRAADAVGGKRDGPAEQAGQVPGDRLGEYVLDANDSFIISAEFSNGAIGVIHSSRWASGHANDQRLRVYGDKGGLELSHGHWGSLLRICAGEDVQTSTWREVTAAPVPTNYQRFADAVHSGIQGEPDFRHAAALQQVLDLALIADLDRHEHSV